MFHQLPYHTAVQPFIGFTYTCSDHCDRHPDEDDPRVHVACFTSAQWGKRTVPHFSHFYTGVIISAARQLDIPVTGQMDDFLVSGTTTDEAVTNLSRFIDLLLAIQWMLAMDKLENLAQRFPYLGITFDSQHICRRA